MLPDEFHNPPAHEIINNNELEELVNQFGSFLTIVTNKPISCVSFFLLLQNNKDLKETLIQLTSTDYYSMITYLAHRYPILNKSKKIK